MEDATASRVEVKSNGHFEGIRALNRFRANFVEPERCNPATSCTHGSGMTRQSEAIFMSIHAVTSESAIEITTAAGDWLTRVRSVIAQLSFRDR